jgi:hypothetical protein
MVVFLLAIIAACLLFGSGTVLAAFGSAFGFILTVLMVVIVAWVGWAILKKLGSY